MHAELPASNGGRVDQSSADQEWNLMAEMLEEYLACHSLERGQIVSGTVVRIGAGDVVVDVGAKCEGVVSAQDLESISPDERDAISVGEEVLVYVINP